MGKVSIIMPAYNAERYITQAIESVVAQTYTDWELIVIDDASQDSTVEIVQKLSAKDSRILLYLNMQNSGVAATRNRGLDMATGEYIAFLDSDDIWDVDKLEKQLAFIFIQKNDLCYCAYTFIDSENNVGQTYHVPNHITYGELLLENVIGCSTVLLKQNCLEGLRFKIDYFHEDYVLWLCLLRQGYTAGGIDLPLAYYREGGRSFNKIKSAHNRWIVYRKVEGLSWLLSVKFIFIYMLHGVLKYRFLLSQKGKYLKKKG